MEVWLTLMYDNLANLLVEDLSIYKCIYVIFCLSLFLYNLVPILSQIYIFFSLFLFISFLSTLSSYL